MKLKQTLIATMILGLPAAALAQSAVQIYGKADADLESVSATGSATGVNYPSRGRVTSNNSNFGIRGTEDLGSGLRAFFQIESLANIDGTQSGFLASRNSAVGLQDSWGQILLGQWDSPYRYSTIRLDPTGDAGIAAYSGILGGTGSVTAGQGGVNFAERASFHRRVSNVVQYWTPSWGGISARFAYGAGDTNVGSTANGVAESTNLRPALYSGSLSYEAGRLYLAAAAERHKDFQSLNTLLGANPSSGKDDAWKLGAQYGFLNNALRLGAIVERLKYTADDINGLGALERKVTDWYLVGEYQLGRHTTALSWGHKGEEKLSGAGLSDLPDSNANQVSARYGYSLSKRTQLYAVATRISNESNAFQTFGYSPITPTQVFKDPARGADPTGFGIGMQHTF